MKGSSIKFIDSHVHLDHIYSDNPDRISWLETAGCTPVSWAFCKPTRYVSDIRYCLENHAEIIGKLSATRFPCYYLAGIHPRNITSDLKPEHIRELILPYLDDPLCRGIGEIGLETGSGREAEILSAHLELAEEVSDRGKVFGIHTPRENKAAVAARTLDLLNAYAGYKDCIVIDHCTPEIIGAVLSAGFWAGITISPIKASAPDVLEIIRRHELFLSKIMLNTDSGSRFYESLHAFIHAAEPHTETGMEIKTALIRTNAARFFNISACE